MTEQAADQQRNRRQRARQRRRSLTAEPFERLDEKARGEDGSGAVKHTLATAAAGAVAAGIAGAAKALRDRQSQEADEKPADSGDEASSSDPQAAEESGEDATEPGAGEDDGLLGEPVASADREDGSDADGEAEQREEQPADDARDESPSDAETQSDEEHRHGTSPGQAKDVVEIARRQLQEILGVEPESISGFERDGDYWTVTLEVIEMKRIPESTDVLSSYEVTIDDDGNVVSAAQRRRYRRSQVEDGR
jgi:Gas vesicle synthesis protein GvpO